MKVIFMVAFATLALTVEGRAVADDQKPSSRRSSIGEADAIRIARGYGMVIVHEVERDDGGWEVEGRDHRGRKLEVKINREGRVTKVERGDRDDDD
jgi:hypothetical protein